MRGQDGRNPIREYLDRQLMSCGSRVAPYLENRMH
jgi:hypothetical protein